MLYLKEYFRNIDKNIDELGKLDIDDKRYKSNMVNLWKETRNKNEKTKIKY